MAPPPEIVPVMVASLLIPILFIVGFVALTGFLIWKLVQSNERHQGTLRELAETRARIGTLETELAHVRRL